jgi:thymidylate synthase ThyX
MSNECQHQSIRHATHSIQQFSVRYQIVEIIYPQITQINADLKN